jgi:type VI secretion system (T6SS) effector TldE1-like protein
MTFGTERRASYSRYDHRRLPPNALPQRLLGGAAAVFTAALCAWTACGFVGSDTERAAIAVSRGDNAAVRGDKLAMVSRRGDKLAVTRPGSSGWIYASLFDPHVSSDASATFSNDGSSLVRPVALTVSTSVPAANPIRSELAAAPARNDRANKSAAALLLRPSAPRGAAPRVATAESATERPGFFRGIFEKLFGKPAPTTLAYAATDDAGLAEARSNIGGRYDRYTAVYDISAHIVYMPDGRRLEAHSGLGSRLDDPRYADERMHGVTPPNIYNLELREAPFHGVRALRMIPEDETKTFGRSGLLAHTYMLGPNGDSNGCVSFKNYDAFLQAYLNHEIKRLAVVARLD